MASFNGAIANSIPARSAPITLRTPQVTTIASHTMPITTVNERGFTVPSVDPYSAPPSPATNALTANSEHLRPDDADAGRDRGLLRSSAWTRTRARQSRVSR